MSEPKFTPGPWEWVDDETDAPSPNGDAWMPSLRSVKQADTGHGYSLPTFIVNADESLGNPANDA